MWILTFNKVHLKISSAKWQPFILGRDVLTLLMLEMDIPILGVSTMSADALAPKVARASAGMVLAVQDWQHVFWFQS